MLNGGRAEMRVLVRRLDFAGTQDAPTARCLENQESATCSHDRGQHRVLGCHEGRPHP